MVAKTATSLRTALAEANAAFESRFGYRRKGQWGVEVSDPTRRVCLQAADYFLWAVQRFFAVLKMGSRRYMDTLALQG